MKNQEKRDLPLLVTKLIEEMPDATNTKRLLSIIFGKRKQKIGHTIKNNYSSTKNHQPKTEN